LQNQPETGERKVASKRKQRSPATQGDAGRAKDSRKKRGFSIEESTYALDLRRELLSARTKGNAKVTLSRARGNFPIASDNFRRRRRRRLVLYVFTIANWLLSAVGDRTLRRDPAEGFGDSLVRASRG